jgi:hypothetical protein
MLMRCWKTRKAPTQKDSKTKELTFKQYDSNAKEISKTVRKASAYVELVISQHTQNKEGQSLSVFPINKVGFVDYRSEKKRSSVMLSTFIRLKKMEKNGQFLQMSNLIFMNSRDTYMVMRTSLLAQ